MARIWEYIKIAVKNIVGNKGRSILTMLGIIIGISSVIMIISIGNSIKGGITNELSNIAGGQICFYSYGDNEDGIWVEFNNDDFEAIKEKVPNVKAVTNNDTFGGVVTGRKGDFTAYVNCGTEGLQYINGEEMAHGRYFTANDYYRGNMVCVLPAKGAKLLFGTTDVVGMTINLSMYHGERELTIVGVRKESSADMLMGMMDDSVTIEVPNTVVDNIYGFSISDMLSQIYVVSDGAENASQVAEDTLRLLENRHNVRGKKAIQMENFNDILNQMNEILNYVTVFVVLVAAISLLVGGIGVMNIMLVSVTERTREIGIRKALGAKTGSILIQFLFEAGIITMLGGIIGILLGVSGAAGVCSIMKSAAEMDFSLVIEPSTVIGATLFSAAVGIFFGLYPARKAAKLSPIEALRHE